MNTNEKKCVKIVARYVSDDPNKERCYFEWSTDEPITHGCLEDVAAAIGEDHANSFVWSPGQWDTLILTHKFSTPKEAELAVWWVWRQLYFFNKRTNAA